MEKWPVILMLILILILMLMATRLLSDSIPSARLSLGHSVILG